MSDLLKYIEKTNDNLINEIIYFIKDDTYWLGELGITDTEENVESSISDLIINKISNQDNEELMDSQLQYLVSDSLIYNDDRPLKRHDVSLDSYENNNSLIVSINFIYKTLSAK